MDYQNLKNYRNSNNPYSSRQGITVEEIQKGAARAVKTVTPDDLNPANVPHGGIYFVLADTACAAAASSYGYAVVTLSANFNFLCSANIGDCLTADATEIQHGQTINVYKARVTNQDGALLSIGTFTMYQLPQKLLY